MSKLSFKADVPIAVIGHLDHGKSTFQARLLYDCGQLKKDQIQAIKKKGQQLAYLLDSFKEEQQNQMTIDTSFSQLKTDNTIYTFIDNPGHLKFIQNMITGTTQAEGAILVVSAHPKETIGRQTKKHLQLVKFFGIKQLLVIINKMDMVNYQKKPFLDLKNIISLLLRETGYELSDDLYIPISAKYGDNVFFHSNKMPWYKGKTVFGLLDQIFHKEDYLPSSQPLRITLQGLYLIKSEPVIMGKIEYGLLKKGQEIIFLPSKKSALVLKIITGVKEIESASAGQTIGIIIKGKPPRKIEQQIISDINHQPENKTDVVANLLFLKKFSIPYQHRLLFQSGTRNALIKNIKLHQRNAVFNQVHKAQIIKATICLDSPQPLDKYVDMPKTSRFLIYQNKVILAAGFVSRDGET